MVSPFAGFEDWVADHTRVTVDPYCISRARQSAQQDEQISKSWEVHHCISRPIAIVLHLFSGRRRQGDIQWQIEREFADQDRHVFVLSLDIIHGAQGDLTNSRHVDFWLAKAYSGVVIATVAGPPCETWSIARFADSAGPPPVRSIDHPFGLPSASPKQLEQVLFGSRLLIVALRFMLSAVRTGAAGILEHPDLIDWHEQRQAPSIWRLEQVQTILACEGAEFLQVQQGQFGARWLKPTRLLSVNLPSLRTRMHDHSSNPDQLESLSGLDEHGRHNTRLAKEYPPMFCKAIAGAIRDLAQSANVGSALDAACGSDVAPFFVPLDPYIDSDIGDDWARTAARPEDW